MAEITLPKVITRREIKDHKLKTNITDYLRMTYIIIIIIIIFPMN
jgi:hypothetical protein